MTYSLLSLCLVSLLVVIYGQSKSKSSCTLLQKSLGETVIKEYCATSDRYKNEGEEKSAQYEKCISRKVKEMAGDCLKDPDNADNIDYRKTLCTPSDTEKSEDVKEATCCIGKKVEGMSIIELGQKRKQVKEECEPKDTFF